MAEASDRIRVLLVDDSSVYRALLRGVLEDESDIDVLAEAGNGKLALPRIRFYKPDVVLLDHEMPEMSGLEVLKHIKTDSPNTAVIMFSSHTVDGAAVTVQALEDGAVDFVTKPTAGGGSNPAEYIKRKIVPRIRHFGRYARIRADRALASAKLERSVGAGIRSASAPRSVELIAIGISTGGPAALREVFEGIKEKLAGPILIVQHMPPIFTKVLAESLSGLSGVKFVEAEEGMDLLPGTAYLAPGGRHMVLRSNGKLRIGVDDSEPVNSARPSVDVLFRSIAQSPVAPRCAAIIMTGMGDDGYQGMKALKARGAYLLAQSEESCLVFGMPQKPVTEGLVDEVHNLEGLRMRIQALLAGGV